MSFSNRRGGSGVRVSGGGSNPLRQALPLGPGSRKPTKRTAATITTKGTTAGRGKGNGECHAPSRFGHFAKYMKPKIGPAFQCAVPKFVPPGGGLVGGIDTVGEDGRDTEGASGSGSGSAGYGTSSASAGRAGGCKGGVNRRGGRAGRGKGSRGGGGGKGGCGAGAGGGSRPVLRGGGSVGASLASSHEAASRVEWSIASGEASAVDIANAAAQHLQINYGSSLRAIPRGGLCIHRPLPPSCIETAGSAMTASNACGLPSSLSSSDKNGNTAMPPMLSLPALAVAKQEDFLTFTRNIFLQTPRPQSEMAIDEIWDSSTMEKFKVDVPSPLVSERRGSRIRGSKRKAATASLLADDSEEEVGNAYQIGSVLSASVKSNTMMMDVDETNPSAGLNAEQPLNQAMGVKREAAQEQEEQESSQLLPLCGLEDDEQALAYLQANYHGDLQKAKFSVMVKFDGGYGVQRRRQLKKKRKKASEAYPDATTFTSESWRWRVHQARPTMLGDYRSSCDPIYYYFYPAPIGMDDLLDASRPWRLKHFVQDDDAVTVDDPRQGVRPRSFSITWSEEEIETAKKIWKSILAYTKEVLQKMGEARNNEAKTPLCDLLELVVKAHALPTPEEAFGRRDPLARKMSENMNFIIEAIESGRDFVARIFKCLNEGGDGIELEPLQRTVDEIEQSCPVGLDELDLVKRQVHEATLWEQKLANNVDNGMANSDAFDGEDVLTEKKLTLEKVERLLSKGLNLTLRPRSLVRLQDRIERAHILRRRISVWNEARDRENPQNIKFISTLIKQANKINLAFPELITLTGVHKKAEEWIDRAWVAIRTSISFKELEELVSVGESLPLNVSDVLEKLQNRLKQAQEWVARLEGMVPKSDDYLTWLGRFRVALEDSEKNAHLLKLLSEGLRIPVTIECARLLQIEIDARQWMVKAKQWIPQSLGNPSSAMNAPQKRGKIDDVKDHLNRATLIRDRLWFTDDQKPEWTLDGESQLDNMIKMAQTWFKKYNDFIIFDSRRNGKLRISMSKLHTIVKHANQIPLNLGNPSTKLNRMFSQANEWMKKHHALIKQCGIECAYVPSGAHAERETLMKPLKINELCAAVTDAASDLSVDLEEVIKLRQILDKVQIWRNKANTVAPKKDSRKKGKQQEKHSMKEISDLIEESSTIIVDITNELDRLKLEQSTIMSWRLQAQQTLKEIISAFNNFRKERAEVCSGATELTGSRSEIPAITSDTADQTPVMINILSGPMTTRNIKLRRRAVNSAGLSGSETPGYLDGGKYLFPLVSNFVKSVKSINTLTPESSVADELSEVISWFTKTSKLMKSPSDIYDRRNFSKLDKSIESGQELFSFNSHTTEKIPEEEKLLHELRQSWATVVEDDVGRLLDLQNQRNKFAEWCEKADETVSSTDKKMSIETLTELEEQSAGFPTSSEIVLRVRKRAKDSFAWIASVAEITKTGQKIPLDEAKVMIDAGEKLNISCPEYKTLRAALRITRGWLLRVKKCGAVNGQGKVAANLVTELINEHNTFLVTAMDALTELKQVVRGYCICRQPYEGFMIGCDGCDEWYHGPCVGISQEQAQKFDKYVCVRCSTLRVYKDNALSVAGILRKWTSAKSLSKARLNHSQRYSRKVRSAERDRVKSKAELQKYERELSGILGLASNALPHVNGEAETSSSLPRSPNANVSAASQNITHGKGIKSEKAVRDKIGKAHTTIGNCEKRMEGYKIELVERKNLEAREDASAHDLKKWCTMVKQEVFSPFTKEVAESSRPHSDGTMSTPMYKAKTYAETLGIANLPDIDSVLNSFKIFSWCLRSLGILMRKPRIGEIRSLLSHSDSGYFKLPEAKCVRMLRSMSSRAQIWQSKVKKALMPVPGETKPFELDMLRELLLAAKQIPLIMPEESRLWSTIEDGGNRHCVCGGPGDGSFMLGCDNCDRWFHGSCMKIDKETGDALSKWICPPCSESVSVEVLKVAELSAIAAGDKKLPAQETINSQLSQLIQPQHDISPHAPDPVFLWPPFSLRSSEEAVEVLGKVGESDNEDFEAPIQSIARAESNTISCPQNTVPQVASMASFATPSVSQVHLCQPIASACLTSSPKSLPQNGSAPKASSVVTSTTQRGSQTPLCRPVAPQNYASQATAACLSIPSVLQTSETQTQGGIFKSARRIAPPNTGVINGSRQNQPISSNIDYQARASAKLSLSQSSKGTNTLSPIISFRSSAINDQELTNPINTVGLNGTNLSAAVANMDRYVLTAGEGVSLPHVAAAPAPAMQMNVSNMAPMKSPNVQSYTTASVPQGTPKAP